MSDTQTPRTKAKIKENLDLLMEFLRKKLPKQIGRRGTLLSDEIEQILFNALDWTANDVQAQASVPPPRPNELDLVRLVLSAHQNAYARFHNGEGLGVIESDQMAIGYASVELAKALKGTALKLMLRDKYGWPIELVNGHPVKNWLRCILHANIWQTWKRRAL